ncbi:MAG: DUF5132 domain-containing protein [Candidatus Binataceae bacterium]
MAKDDKDDGTEAIKGQSNPRGHESRAHAGSKAERSRREPLEEHGGSEESGGTSEGGSWIASAALIGIGALIEPELLGGMILGAGVVYATRGLPAISGFVRPLMKSVVKASYVAASKATELVAEATEDIQDIFAEVRAEHQSEAGQHSGIVVPSSEESY